jgi:site-specific recombinase XerD
MLDLKGFKKYLECEGRSANTIASYLFGVRAFQEKYKTVNQDNFNMWKKQLIVDFKPKTVNIRLSSVKSYANYKGIFIKFKGVKMPRALSVENVITLDEYNSLCERLLSGKEYKKYWTIRFLGETGARASEFIRLTKNGLKQGYEDMWTKGKVRRIYFPPELIQESAPYFDSVDGELLFPSRFGKTMTTRGLGGNLRNMSDAYGIRVEVMHPHSFRHFFAKEFLRKGGDVMLLRDLLGHESIDTTSIYTQLSTQEIVDKFSNINKSASVAKEKENEEYENRPESPVRISCKLGRGNDIVFTISGLRT